MPIELLPHQFKDLLHRPQKKQIGFGPSVNEGKEHDLILARKIILIRKRKKTKPGFCRVVKIQVALQKIAATSSPLDSQRQRLLPSSTNRIN